MSFTKLLTHFYNLLIQPYFSSIVGSDLSKEIKLVKNQMVKDFSTGQPIYDPEQFEQFCKKAGATTLYQNILASITSTRHSPERQKLNKKVAVNTIYTLCFGLSQKCNFLQKDLAIYMLRNNANQETLDTTRQLGATCSYRTAGNNMQHGASNYRERVNKLIKEATDNKWLITCIIDDYTSVHSKRRPTDCSTSKAASMCTIVIRIFPTIPAIERPADLQKVHEKGGLSLKTLQDLITSSTTMDLLSSAYVEKMPDWMKTKFFDPEMERERLNAHQYSVSDNVRKLRKMDNLHLLSFKELKLKSKEGYEIALDMILNTQLKEYMKKFLLLCPGDWPTQFYTRKIVYEHLKNGCETEIRPDQSCAPHTFTQTANDHLYNLICPIPALQSISSLDPLLSIIPLLGALHISLNAREHILIVFHPFFKSLYEQIFPSSKLAEKPMPWRTTLLLEVIYGGWTLIRETVLKTFEKCKDIQYGVLINLLDNYIPATLAIYSLCFKMNQYKDYFKSMISVWKMFYCFQRRHYNKAPLIWLSNNMFWRNNTENLYDTIYNNVTTITDEYPVENTHSIFRAQTKPHHTPEQLEQKAKEIFASKQEQHHFRSHFTPPKNYTFSRKQLTTLKTSAAKCLTAIFKKIVLRPSSGLPPATQDYLPEVFGDQSFDDQRALPLGFQSKLQPNCNQECDFPACPNKGKSTPWKIFPGCWHSFHENCLAGINHCPICQVHIHNALSKLVKTASDAIVSNTENTAAAESHKTPQNENQNETAPIVLETDQDQENLVIQKLNSDISSLKPIIPNSTSNSSEHGDLNFNRSKKAKPQHCKTCSHSVKGHKRPANDSIKCPMCPNQLCSSAGKQQKCSCDWHSTTITEESKTTLQVIGNVKEISCKEEYSQAQLTENDSSNACTVIALLTATSFFQGDIAIPDNNNTQEVATHFITKIIEGNTIYDIINPPEHQPNLSVPDVLSSVQLPIEEADPFQAIMDNNSLFQHLSQKTSQLDQGKRKAFVLIVRPCYSMVICCSDSHISLFDSHSHRDKGALIAFALITNIKDFVNYIEMMIHRDWKTDLKFGNLQEVKIKQ